MKDVEEKASLIIESFRKAPNNVNAQANLIAGDPRYRFLLECSIDEIMSDLAVSEPVSRAAYMKHPDKFSSQDKARRYVVNELKRAVNRVLFPLR